MSSIKERVQALRDKAAANRAKKTTANTSRTGAANVRGVNGLSTVNGKTVQSRGQRLAAQAGQSSISTTQQTQAPAARSKRDLNTVRQALPGTTNVGAANNQINQQERKSIFEDGKDRVQRQAINPEFQNLTSEQRQLNEQKREDDPTRVNQFVDASSGRQRIRENISAAEKQALARGAGFGSDAQNTFNRVQQNQSAQATQQTKNASSLQRQENQIRLSLGISSDTEFKVNKDGKIEIVEEDGTIVDPVERARRENEEEKQEAVADLQERLDKDLAAVPRMVDGSYSTQSKRRLAEIEREHAKRLDSLNEAFDTRLQSDTERAFDTQESIQESLGSQVVSAEDQQKKLAEQEKVNGVNAIVDEFTAKGEAISIQRATNIWNERQKYDAKGDEEARVGVIVDDVLSSDIEDVDKFQQIYSATGSNIDEAYKAIKSRTGEANAKKVKDQWLADNGFSKEQIELENVSSLGADIFNGEKSDPLYVGKFENDLKSSGASDDLIYRKLLALSESPNASLEVKREALGLSEDYKPEDQSSGDNGSILSTLSSRPELFESLTSTKQTELLEGGYIPPKGTGGSFEDFLDLSPTIYGIPTQLINSDKERERFEQTVQAGRSEGKSRLDIQKAFLGFNIEDQSNEPFAQGLLEHIQSISQPLTADYQNTARLINSGNTRGAIDRVEKRVLADTDPTFVLKKSLTDELVKKSDQTLKLLSEVDPSLLGVFDSKKLSFTKKFTGGDLSPEERKAQQLQSSLVALIQPWRKENAGVAVSEQEQKFLEDLMATINDQPEGISIKVQSFAESALQGYNSQRLTSGLPEVGFEHILGASPYEDLYKSSQQEAPQSQKSVQDITRDEVIGSEGFRSEAYLDQAGIPTVGYGFTSLNGQPVTKDTVITREEADAELQKQIDRHATWKESVSVDLTPEQQAALTSFNYNLGPNIWKTPGGARLIDFINNGQMKEASELMLQFNKYRDPNSGELTISQGLKNRREREASTFFKANV